MANLVRSNPFEELVNLWPRDFFSRVEPGGSLAVEWNPRCDVSEGDDAIIIHAELPGVAAQDMEVTVLDSTLRIRGEKRGEKKEEEKGRTYSERFFGSFERTIAIPATVDASKIEATLKDGVLEVKLPRTLPVEPAEKKITIRAT
ncbi:MAG: Hsp20/alpha crystallin family protein [Thermoflexaceae bacterium]|nr:Hsp20/alpha crystallin family protein [Thermoflexaceae bacterium]